MKHLIIIISLFLNFSLFGQNTYVPDDNFEQALIDLGYDDVLDDYVLTANISGLTNLNISDKSISDLTGIEDFTALEYLYISSNLLTSVDISANSNLTVLYCDNNQLSALNTSSNFNLAMLFCNNNNITNPDISANTNLTQIDFSNNQVSNINFSTNTQLTEITCDNNQLSNLNLSSNSNLSLLYCNNNLLTNLNLAANINLEELSFEGNQINNIDLSNNINLQSLYCKNGQLSELDLSSNTILTSLQCNSNQLTNLNVKNGNNINFQEFNSSNNPNLNCIFVDDAAWSTTNWTDIDANSTFVETEAECDALNVKNIKTGNLTIYPNPVKENFSINSGHKIENIYIYDVFGKLIKVYEKQENYSVSNLTTGVYLIHVKSKKGILISKLIVE